MAIEKRHPVLRALMVLLGHHDIPKYVEALSTDEITHENVAQTEHSTLSVWNPAGFWQPKSHQYGTPMTERFKQVRDVVRSKSYWRYLHTAVFHHL